jgi:hypothetical protein
MSKHIVIKPALVILLITALTSFSFASKKTPATRAINLAGLIFDAGTMAPVGAAKIYDGDGNLLGVTDSKGYYNVTINYVKSGEMYFKVKIEKQDFQSFEHNEHWGNLGDTKTIMYFGLKESHSNAKPFSSFAGNTPIRDDLSYENVLHHFEKVKLEKQFNDKLAGSKAGNENVLIKIDDQLYIVDSTGWIKIDSEKDLISIDGERVLTADKLNSTIKRKDVKGMTPLDSKEAKFAIYTKRTHK